jgi:hypothetical protein
MHKLTTGKVIQTGTVISGIRSKYFLIFYIMGLVEPFGFVNILNKVTTPPNIGNIPVGSGEDKSLNHQKPSVKIAGLVS